MPSPLVADVGITDITTSAFRPSYIASGTLGSFKASNGNWYAIYFIAPGPTINVYKSTDNGATFSTLVATGASINVYVSAYRVPGTDFIYVAYLKADNTIVTDKFDMASETFAGVNDPSVDTTGFQMLDQGLNIAATSAGDILLTWTLQDGGQTTAECYAKVFSGSWGSQIHINAGVPRGVAETQIAIGNTFGILWSNWIADSSVGSSFGTRVSLFYSIVSGGAITSTVTALLDASLVNNSALSWPVLYPGVYDPVNDRVAFPIPVESHPHDPSTNTMSHCTLVGVPSSAPVFTLVTVFTTAIGVIASSPRLGGPTGAPFSVIWGGFPAAQGRFSATANPPTPFTYVLMWAQDNGSGTTTYQNCVSTSLTTGWTVPGQFLDTGVATTDTDPQYFFWVNTERAASTQTLELTKIVVGGPAVPGDWNLSAEMGSPPTGISGAGHVGPSEVGTGAYELDEVAFPGITFDSQTGTWQDDAHTWGGDYAAGAWDCGGATMPTPTSVIVPASGVVACTITNTFIPTPPPPGPGNGEENPVGCWELLRVDVTLMPSRHLPTRGSVK